MFDFFCPKKQNSKKSNIFEKDNCSVFFPAAQGCLGRAMNTLRVLLCEYTEILVGNRHTYSGSFFQGSAYENEQLAINFVRLVAKTFLRCDNPQAAIATMNEELVAKMHLDKMLKYIQTPDYLEASDIFDYDIARIFTPHFNAADWSAHRFCEQIVRGEMKKFPKYYMTEIKGMERASLCLRYFLSIDKPGLTVEQCYRYAACPDFQRMLHKRLLWNVCMKQFGDPLTFMHMSLGTEMCSRSWYCVYTYMYKLGTVPKPVIHARL